MSTDTKRKTWYNKDGGSCELDDTPENNQRQKAAGFLESDPTAKRKPFGRAESNEDVKPDGE